MAGVAGMLCAAAGASCNGASGSGGIGAWSIGGLFGGLSGGSPAALIIVNARVWTVDPSRPEAEAVAIVGDRIVAVGARAEVEKWRGAATRIIDAGGRFVMPGFNDAHIHLMTGGAQLDHVDLKDAATPREFARRIEERAKNAAKGEWILGGNWDEQGWPGAPLPTRTLVDAVTPDTPVFVTRYDEHMSLANSVALRVAGVTAATPDPPGGVIVRDGKGNPTGILKDAAQAFVFKVIPPPTAEQRTRTLRRALGHMASLGVTSVQDMGPDPDDVAIYEALASRGELTARIRAVPAEVSLATHLGSGPARHHPSAFLRVSGAKGFADGSLGSTTAYFFEPYTDDPASRGLLADEMQPLDGMRARLIAFDKAGEQLCIHAIGDRAISMVLDLFEDVQHANGPRDRRPRIEHSQHVAPKDFVRYAQLGAIASVQPYHAIDDGKWAEKRIGAERAKTTCAFRSFLDNRVRVAFGTDWPVAPLDPMQTLYAAVTRATLDGKRPGGWVPEQKVSVSQAIEAYTMGAAYAEFEEGNKGSIRVGKLADLVMLSGDPFGVPPEAIAGLKVAMTMAGGKVVYERR
jgi:predicted amidohydrolase YtcJ